jgi:hypothetical protein
MSGVKIQLPRRLTVAGINFGPQVNPAERFGEFVTYPALDDKKLSGILIVYKVAAGFHQMKLLDTCALLDGFRLRGPRYIEPQSYTPCN